MESGCLIYVRLCERCAAVLLTPFSGGTPAADSDRLTGGEDISGSGQANGSNGRTEGHR